jgi:hypothetical protein
MDKTIPRLFSRARALLAIAKASASASTLSIVLGGLPSPALAADDPAASPDPGDVQNRAPHLIFGGGVGYANHWGRTVAVDAVTGASTPANEFSEHGLALNAFADVSAIELGHGSLGASAAFTVALPKIFMNVALVPRYRLFFPLAGATVRSIEPWLGLGVAFAFRDHIGEGFYLWVPVTAGCDFQLGSKGLYGGIGVDLDMANPKGVNRGSAGKEHMDNVVVLLRLGYRVL